MLHLSRDLIYALLTISNYRQLRGVGQHPLPTNHDSTFARETDTSLISVPWRARHDSLCGPGPSGLRVEAARSILQADPLHQQSTWPRRVDRSNSCRDWSVQAIHAGKSQVDATKCLVHLHKPFHQVLDSLLLPVAVDRARSCGWSPFDQQRATPEETARAVYACKLGCYQCLMRRAGLFRITLFRYDHTSFPFRALSLLLSPGECH